MATRKLIVDGKEIDITEPAGLKWDFSNDVNLDPPRDRTFMQDQLFVRNREGLRGLLKPDSIVIVLANDIYPTNADGTMAFKQNADLFHLTGVDQEDTVLVLMPDAKDPKEREILFVKETSEHIAIWDGEKLSKEQARAATGIDSARMVNGPSDTGTHPRSSAVVISVVDHPPSGPSSTAIDAPG